MNQDALANLSHVELRDRLAACATDPRINDLNSLEVLRHFTALPLTSHTSESADALIQLCRIFFTTAQPSQALESASLAARIAVAVNDRRMLSRARNKEGYALLKFEKFAEATVAQADAWSIARELKDKTLELHAVWAFSTLSVAIGQWNVAIHYCERMRALAEETGSVWYELAARANLADCALQLRDPLPALRTLAKPAAEAPRADISPDTYAHVHINLGRSWLLMQDLAAASHHTAEAARWAAIWNSPITVNGVKALQGLVDVHLGSVDSGLLAVNDALTFAKRANASEVPNLLGICIDAYEAAGELDEASVYLNKLVEWKKKSVEAVVNGWQLEGLADAAQLQTDGSLLDVGLLAKARSIQLEGESRLERLFETAVNAEIASGHDIYRPCRLGNLARHVAESLGWSQGRIVRLVWGARLCNIGMIAIPARILVKQEPLSDGESDVLHAHTDYAAELLRKSQLQILDVAALVAKQHHEHYDGSGYPLRLRHGAIAEEARIVSVCDAFDAMTHKSPSRRIPLSIDAALTELAQRANTQFDPQIVNVFVNFIRRELPQHDNFEAFLTDGADDVEYVRVRARIDSSIVGADVLDLSDLG